MPASLVILAYHHVDRRFRSHLPILRACGRLVSLREGIEALERRTAHSRMVAVTFDDFYQEVHDQMCGNPSIRDVPATAFMATAYAGSDAAFWWDELSMMVARTSVHALCWKNRSYRLSTPQDRTELIEAIHEDWLPLPPSTIQDRLQSLRKSLALGAMDISPEFRPANWEQVTALSRTGIEIGSHTITHPYLTSLSDDDARRELAESKQRLEGLLETRVNGLAYPFGGEGSYDDRIAGIAQACGYDYAVTTVRGVNRSGGNRFKLTRTCVYMHDNPLRVFLKACGLSILIRRLMASRNGRVSPTRPE